MVKITTLVVAATLATLSPVFVVAETALKARGKHRDCTKGLLYCGYVLEGIGPYDLRITEALEDYGFSWETQDNWTRMHTIFKCTGGRNGEIVVHHLCRNPSPYCTDGGGNKNDYCQS